MILLHVFKVLALCKSEETMHLPDTAAILYRQTMHMLLFRVRTSHLYLILYYAKHEILNLASDSSK